MKLRQTLKRKLFLCDYQKLPLLNGYTLLQSGCKCRGRICKTFQARYGRS